MIVPTKEDKNKNNGDKDGNNNIADPSKTERDERMKKDFPNIQEDKFDSDEDDDYNKNKQLEQISHLINKQGDEPGKSPAQTKNFSIGEKGDIISKFKVPVNQNNNDLEMALPSGSDSSKFSSDEENKDDDNAGN